MATPNLEDKLEWEMLILQLESEARILFFMGNFHIFSLSLQLTG